MLVEGLEVVQRIRSGEELGVVLLEEGAIVLDLKASPLCALVDDFLAFLRSLRGVAVNLTGLLLIGARLALLVTFTVRLLVNELLAASEVGLNLLVTGHATLHPRVCTDIVNSGSLLRVESHHLLEEVFELGRVKILTILSLSVRLPEELRAVGGKEAVVRVLWVGRGERRPLRQDDEEDDGAGEEVDAGALVRLAKVDLRSHVGSGA